MEYNLYFNIAAFFIFLVILIIDVVKKKTAFLQNKMFSVLVALGFIGVTVSTAGSFLDMNPQLAERWVMHLFSYLHFLLIGVIPFAYAIYILALNEMTVSQLSTRLKLMVLGPQLIQWLLIGSNFFIRSLFFYDQNGVYQRGNLQPLFYLTVFYYGLFGAIYVTIYKNATTIRLRMALYVYFAIGCFTSLLQFAIPWLVVQYFGIAMCELIIAFMIQRPEEYLDSVIGVFNKSAFRRILSLNMQSGKKMRLLLICVEDLKFLNQTVGSARMNEYMRLIAEYLEELAQGKVYLLTSSTFAILLTDADKKSRTHLSQQIKERFAQDWVSDHNSIRLVPRMMKMELPRDMKEMDTVLACCVYLRRLDNTPEGVLTAAEVSLSSTGRITAVEKSIKNAIQKNSFEMYYQPIFSVKERKITSAEALIRLFDEELGFVPPDEFIPLAEKNGSIIRVGEQIFHKVFSFMKEEKLKEKGIFCMEINLSVVQCMQEELAGQVLDLMEQYEIEAQSINLEITETAAANMPTLLMKNMELLSDKKVRFSLDDFGTGYSNFSSLMTLPLNLIKFDKTLVDMASASEKGLNILRSLTVMAQNMNLRIVAEGVETKQQADMLSEMGVDFLQGYYFSKPLPSRDFIQFVENFNRE